MEGADPSSLNILNIYNTQLIEYTSRTAINKRVAGILRRRRADRQRLATIMVKDVNPMT